MGDPEQELEKVVARYEAESEERVAKLNAKLDAQYAEMEQARTVSRDAIFRVVALSAAIVGFSATLLSIENLDLAVQESRLRWAWVLFAVAVALGPIVVSLESRTQY